MSSRLQRDSHSVRSQLVRQMVKLPVIETGTLAPEASTLPLRHSLRNGLTERLRSSDLVRPRHALYQAELQSDENGVPTGS